MKKKILKIIVFNLLIAITPFNLNANPISTSSLPNLTFAAEKTVKSVVHVRTKIIRRQRGTRDDELLEFFFGIPRQRNSHPIDLSSGSGVVVSSDGYIVTNFHVIKGADVIEIILNDKRKYYAKLIGFDKRTDIALLKINEKKLNYCKYGDSNKIKLGEWVLAVGNPYSLVSSVTAGIISAKARNLDINRMNLTSFIQTDAAVNPGNSGGALVNIKGELIGMNTLIYSQTGSYSGYSFAVPVNVVKKVVADLIEYKKVRRAYLGVYLSDINSDMSKRNNIPLNGVLITDVVPNGSASKAGIKPGDVILKISGEETASATKLIEIINSLQPDSKIKVELSRKGKKVTTYVKLMNY